HMDGTGAEDNWPPDGIVGPGLPRARLVDRNQGLHVRQYGANGCRLCLAVCLNDLATHRCLAHEGADPSSFRPGHSLADAMKSTSHEHRSGWRRTMARTTRSPFLRMLQALLATAGQRVQTATAGGRLYGPTLMLARAAWLAVAALTSVLFVVSTSIWLGQVRGACPPG